MERIRRLVASGVVAAALVAGVQGPALAGTRPGIRLNEMFGAQAHSRYVWVIYHTRSYSSVRIHGRITGAASGMVLRLYARRFPYAQSWRQIQHVTLQRTGTDYYHFTATPTLATRYKLKLFLNASSAYPLAITRAATVYVLADYKFLYNKRCRTRPRCHILVHIRIFVPPSVLAAEISKRFYAYFGHALASVGTPPRPRWLYLGAGHPGVTGPRKVAANQFNLTVSFSFRIDHERYSWEADFCSKDTEASDGLNLPGHHGCGDVRISGRIHYLG